jgi:hypothetical protein
LIIKKPKGKPMNIKSMIKKLEALSMAAAFAEEGELETAQEIITSTNKEIQSEEKIAKTERSVHSENTLHVRAAWQH